MSLCNLLKRPQRFNLADQLDSLRELELSLRCWNRGRLALRTDLSFRNMLDQVCENALARFHDNHQSALNALSNQLSTYLQPHQQAINAWISVLGGKDCEQATEYLLSSIMDWIEAIEAEEIEAFLTELFDLLHDELEAGVQSLFTEIIEPAIDELSALLEDDFIGGVTDSSAFNRFMLGKDLQDLKEKLLAVGDEIPPFAREYYLDPLLDFIRTSPLLTQLDQMKEVVKSSKEVVEKLLAVIKIVSANTSVQGSGPGRYLWYASWLLEDNYWEINTDYCQGALFTLDSTYATALDSTQFPTALQNDFNDQFLLNATPTVQVITAGEHWRLQGSNGDPDFYLLRRNGNGKIKAFRIYPAAEWKQIAPLTNYTFKTINARTCDDWAYHSSWFIDLVKGILHALAMEPTAATGSKSDALSNLSNMLLNLTYGSLKLGGPKGCDWSRTDPHLNSIWAKSVVPFISTMISSLEGIHRNTGTAVGSGGARFSYWISLAAKDVGEKYLIDRWCQLLRDAVLSYITLVNYDGPKTAPLSGTDNRPANRKTLPLLVKLMDEVGVWLTVALFPQSWYGFPGSGNPEHGGTVLAHWLGTGSILAFASTLFGAKIAESIGEVEDHTATCKSLKRGLGNMLIKFPVYLYLANESNTRRGRLSHVATPMFGYPSAETSPYFLPFPNNTVQHCVQGNQGLWSHNSLQSVSTIYAYDFALDFGDDVVAARKGIVWAFADNQADDTDTENNWADTGNFIQLLHTGDPMENHKPLEEHDQNLQKDSVRTFAEYRHGRVGSISSSIGGALHTGTTTISMRPVSTVLVNANIKSDFFDFGVDLDLLYANDNSATIAVEVTFPGGDLVGPYFISQGTKIMQAGNTGRVAFNQLHMQVQPARQATDGKVLGTESYTIPFVFQEVKGTFFGREGVPRSGHYYQSENV